MNRARPMAARLIKRGESLSVSEFLPNIRYENDSFSESRFLCRMTNDGIYTIVKR